MAIVVTGCGGSAPMLPDVVEAAVAAGPGPRSTAYREPGTQDADRLGAAVRALLGGDARPEVPDRITVAEARVAGGGSVRTVQEKGTNSGWGVYAARVGAGVPAGLVVEAPHPRSDRYTEALAPRLFAALGADALLVSDAHRTADRGSADAAHEPGSGLAAVDRAVVGAGTVVLQVHGFHEGEHDLGADVVLSSTVADPAPLVLRLADALAKAGFRPCVYDGHHCAALAGTTNVEAAHARTVGATFVHLELAEDIRAPGTRQDSLVSVLSAVLRR